MRFCEHSGCSQPVFGTCKQSRKGYCRSHQTDRLDFNRKSITQRAIEKHKANPTKQIVKESRFKRGTFDESVLNTEIKYVTHTPECYNGKRVDIETLDEIGVTGMGSNNIGMDSFWKYAAKVIANTERCWECNEYISPNDYRNSTGHIFPKSTFPSVADNIWNFVVVGNRCGCHNRTHTLETFSKMAIFRTAVNRYTKFCHLITENHKYHDLFLDYANQIM